MRLALTLAFLLLVPAVAADSFGRIGPALFVEVEVPASSASEPTIGIPWTTNSVFYHAGVATYRARFDEQGNPNWAEVTAPYQIPINLDPMLTADVVTGRVFAGGLLGPCSEMLISDDDGETWTPSINMCSGANFDHQTIGTGPPAGPLPVLGGEGGHVAYYCAQGGTISCARSLDGGAVWGPFQNVPGSCQGFHGHAQVSPVNGFVAIPTASCGDKQGYIASADGGLTWTSNQVPGSDEWTNGFDPSLQFTRQSGWMYYGMASDDGIHIALSKDNGATWESLGASHGEPTGWLDLGALHDPPIWAGSFTDVEAGDDDRVAFSFYGIEESATADKEFLRSEEIYKCDSSRQADLVWRSYIATSFDAGQTWSVARVSDDPVQVGGMWDVVIGGDGSCRNLLDFKDMDIDVNGRIVIGFADGCTGECAATLQPESAGYRDNAARLHRQVAGRGLFATADIVVDPVDLDGDGTANVEDKDLDGDGIDNSADSDVDGDGVGDQADDDQDADGIVDAQDPVVEVAGRSAAPSSSGKGTPLPVVLLVLACLFAALRRR
ncbi:MAG: sialidase family protein [Candidatus Thermoplasmatota archaeon]